MNDYSKYSCKKCNGSGKYYRCNLNRQAMPTRCDECGGDGYLDWVENVVGKSPRLLEASFDTSSFIDIKTSRVAVCHARQHGKSKFLEAQQLIDKEIIQVMSNKIASDIDRLIMDELTGKARKEKG
jgi:hypothetical protein